MWLLRKRARNTISIKYQKRNTSSTFKPSFDPQAYTDGRWLHRNDERQEARRLQFNFDALLGVAMDRNPGATRVVSCEKQGGRGSLNHGFAIRLDNGKCVIARLPTKMAGLPRATVSSEVATLQFIKKFTTIPVPDVVAWSSQSDNPVGADYIITNVMPGVLLRGVWEAMTTSQHITCIESIAHLVRELCTVNFPGYGSLYNLEDGHDDLLAFDAHHGLGPLCKTRHHESEQVQADELRNPTKFLGPWTSLEAYYADHFTKAHSRMPTKDSQHAKLLYIAHRTIQTLISQDPIQKAGVPLLSHLDLHKRNILVSPQDPTVVTGILEWQSSVVEPAYVFAAETPDFADEVPELVINENSPEGRAHAILKAEAEYCKAAWSMVPTICPKFCEASKLDVSVLQLLSAPSHKWLEDEDCVQMILRDIKKKWSALGLPGESFYQPSREEAVALELRLDHTRDLQKLRGMISQHVGCDNDGWVAADCWDDALPRYRDMYSSFVESVAESDPDEDADALWPFDQR